MSILLSACNSEAGTPVWQPEALARHAYSASAREGSAFKRKLIARNRIWTLARCFPARLLPASAPSMALFDLLALGYGIVRDRPSAIGRAEALARLLPRWCERREIAPDGGDVEPHRDLALAFDIALQTP